MAWTCIVTMKHFKDKKQIQSENLRINIAFEQPEGSITYESSTPKGWANR